MTALVRGEHGAGGEEGPRRRGFLVECNPLAKILAVLPALTIVLCCSDSVALPLTALLAALVLVLVGARPRGAALRFALLGVPLFAVLSTIGFSLWASPGAARDAPVLLGVGSLVLRRDALEIGATTGLRIAALLALGLLPALSTSGPELARSLVRQLRVPYRIGYTAIAAFRFVPRFGAELDTIRLAHRARGMHGGRGPLGIARRWLGVVVPLLVGAIRHAERVALTMDSRAFGAYPTRTERHDTPWRARDWLLLALVWVASAGLFGLR